jgi:UDP-N-acetylmuramate--alanine ligase
MLRESRIAAATARLLRVLGHEPARWLLVDVARQELSLIVSGTATATFAVSTAAVGIDARQGSGGTPPGVHRIARKIGGGMPLGTVFEDREATGEVWEPTAVPVERKLDDARDLILTRILTLEGLEEGINRGADVDSLARYIYLHGTNHEDLVGTPVSHGCVRLTNRDIGELFDAVAKGDPVVIA